MTVSREIYDGENADLVRYKEDGRFWGGGRLVRSTFWDAACNNFHLGLHMQQDLLDHIESKDPGTDPEKLNYSEIKEYCRDIFKYEDGLGAVYKNALPKSKTVEYGK